MKRSRLFFLIILMAFSASLKADPLGGFQLLLGGGTGITAGTTMTITITAVDINSNIKTDYNGPIALTASVGTVIVADPGNTFTTIADMGNTLTQNFVLGRWTGNITLTGAGIPVTITCVDYTGGYTGNGLAFQNVTPGPFANLLVLYQGMTWAPGTQADPLFGMSAGDGYSGSPETPTTYTPFYVTVMAVDAWSNTIVAGFPKISISTGDPYTVTPTSVDMSVDSNATTIFAMTIYPSPDKAKVENITAQNIPITTISSTLSMYFTSLSDYYIWASAPLSVVAGKPFNVSVSISHYPPTGGVGGLPISSLDDSVQISGIDGGTGAALNPGLLPTAVQTAFTTAGVATFTGVSYTMATLEGSQGIRIQPKYNGVSFLITNATDLDRDSNMITVYADKPDHFTMSASKNKVALNEPSIISATVYDQYGNPVSNTAVDFTINSGNGTFTESTSNTQDAVAVTGSLGTATVHYSSDKNSKVYIDASLVASLPGMFDTVTVESGTVLDKSIIRNFPNPFNPVEGVTTIEYYLESDSSVSFKLYSFSGQLVWSKQFGAGSFPGGRQGYNPVAWNGITDSGMTVGAGLYTLKVDVSGDSGKYTLTRKIAVKK
jgi:flagellar hook assembly protein FlgD